MLKFVRSIGLGALVLAAPLAAQSPAPPHQAAPARAAELRRVAAEAYLYLYPLVTMDVTRRVATDPRNSRIPGLGPVNAVHHMRKYPDASFRTIVRPNFDTLYTNAWIDLSSGPVTMRVPDAQGRYYLLQFLDMWTDSFAMPGTRTSGNGAGAFALVPPGWQGALPKGVARINAPTRWVRLIGRTQTNGSADYANVHKVQDAMSMAPLRPVPKPASEPPLDLSIPPKELVDAMPALEFLGYAARLLQVTEVHPTDWSQLERLKAINLGRGLRFDAARLTPAESTALADGMADGQRALAEREATLNPGVNGWTYGTDTVGVYGNYYLKRAIIARRGLGANPPEDAIYMSTLRDGTGQRLKGETSYTLHFDKGALPPAGAFWSVTLYDGEGFPVANPINRHALGDRDPLGFNPDGSLDLLIQSGDPGEGQQANWLPSATSGPISLMIRIYAPKDEVLSRRWVPPPVVPR